MLFTHFYEAPKSFPQGLLSNITIRPACCILDLRTAVDFDSWHLPGSVNVPLRSLSLHTAKPFANPDVLEALCLEMQTLFSDDSKLAQLVSHHVLVICYNGDTARIATSVLRAQGVQADSLRGGYQALKDHGLWEQEQVDGSMVDGCPSVSVSVNNLSLAKA